MPVTMLTFKLILVLPLNVCRGCAVLKVIGKAPEVWDPFAHLPKMMMGSGIS